MARLNIKSQTPRATTWKEGLNCVAVYLDDGKIPPFGVAVQATEWGQRTPIDPVIIFIIAGVEYRFTVAEFTRKLQTGRMKP